MADSLLGLDPSNLGSTIQGLLSQMGPSQDLINAANKRAQLDFFLGLLGAPKGLEFRAAGQSGLNALNERDNYIRTQQGLAQQNMALAMPMLQLAQRQQLLNNLNDTMSGAMQPTPSLSGPPQPFQQNGGAAGAMNAGVTGSGTATTLPTSQNLPAYQADPNMRQRLARAGVLAKAGLNIDLSPELKFLMPDPIRVNAGAGVFNPATGQFQMTPKAVEGSQLTQGPDGSWSYTPVGNAPAAMALPKVTANMANLATSPQKGILPGGGEGVVGTELGALGGPNPAGPYAFLSGMFGNQSAPQNTPASSAPSGPVQTKLSPEEQKRQDALGEVPNAIDNQAAQAQVALGRNEDMRRLFSQFQTGAMTPVRREVASYAQAFGLPDSVVSKVAGGNLSAMQAAQKQVVNAAFEATKTLTPRPAQAEVIMSATKGTANEAMTPAAINAILDYNKGVYTYQGDMQKAKDEWLADRSHHGSMQGFAGAFNATHPLDSYLPSTEYLNRVLRGGSAPAAPSAQSSQPAAKTVVRTGTFNGKRVVQYSDGTVSYQ